jgi:hypothetical protein
MGHVTRNWARRVIERIRERSAGRSPVRDRSPVIHTQPKPVDVQRRVEQTCANARSLAPYESEYSAEPVRATTTTIYTKCNNVTFLEDLTLKKMPGDNSCMFHAIACAVNWKARVDASAVRQMTADYMKSNAHVLAELLGFSRQDFVNHVTRLCDKNTFGQIDDLIAISRLFNLTIKVYNAKAKECILIRPLSQLPDILGLPHSIAYLYFYNEHYNVYI